MMLGQPVPQLIREIHFIYMYCTNHLLPEVNINTGGLLIKHLLKCLFLNVYFHLIEFYLYFSVCH